ncbi:alpha-ketoacid dehydrogenase subunit beta [Agrococcus casei]|uniref:3-methyl-2-oxobutanoate dehydrogenase (2-methylpropanoyl-transferring) n=1 Tax=Agrococcus casei LMG 22410 TaxID=1255656 RepID=A0A1R4G938_9MICO|nr:transketolase C-terminal domain-containing protein [Agrococcus casei]SJM64689.1 Branched-chain alpha-keto acid dehydrogenase, E1 component, beta subunit [Agrococcus casei LMG 22410]
MTEQLSTQKAINTALREILADDAKSLVFGEDVGKLGGVFRVTDGLQTEFGAHRVIDTPLAESGILGMAAGLAMAGHRPIPEVQFDGFAYPAMNQIISQIARTNYRSRGATPMQMVLRIPSYGGIRAPELHGESIEATLAHVPGLKVVSPSNPHQAYHLLRRAHEMPDPVMFMEPKSRYWNRGDVDFENPGDLEGSLVAREGEDLTIIAWGAMVARSLEVAELAAEDDVSIEVVDARWLKPLDEDGLVASVAKTGRAVIVHEAPRTAGLGAEIGQLLTERLWGKLEAPVERVTGYDVPTPAGDLEDEYIPSIDRILFGVQRSLEY